MTSFVKMLAAAFLCTVMAAGSVFAQVLTVDYDHAINFLKYKTYTLQKVHATDPSVEQTITIALDRNLTARYLHSDGNGEIIVGVVEATSDKQEYGTFYDGLGGLGWQRPWGGGFLDTTATVQDIPAGTVVIDMWDRKTQKLIWRGMVTGGTDKKMDKAVGQVLAQFPPKFKK